MSRSRAFKPVVAALIALLAGAASFAGLTAGVFSGWQRRLGDQLFPAADRDERIVVVAIDDRSLSAFGRWPWDRTLHARLLSAIEAGGPAVVGYDVTFSEPSADPASDRALADVMSAAGNVVLADTAIATGKIGALPRAESFETPVESLRAAAAATGHSNVIPDPDGVYRTLPPVIEGPDFELAPSLSLALLEQAEGASGPLTLRTDGVSVGEHFVATGEGHLLTVNFATTDFPLYSARDVMQGRVPASAFDGRIVLIGATARGLGDIIQTPVDKHPGLPGVVFQANALNTMLTADYVFPASRAMDAGFAALLALVVALAVLYLPVLASLLIPLGGGFAYVLYSFRQFDGGRLHDLVYPPLSIAFAVVGALGVRALTELRQRRRITGLFAEYVPDAVVKQLTEPSRMDATLAGERLDISVLFCDLRGFTPLSASLTPAGVRDILEVYYRHLTQKILDHGGTVMQYVGDEIFAVFGAPLPREDHAAAAVAAARDMALEKPAIDAELANAGLPPINYGIGVNSGEVVAGIVGNIVRRQYTVIGDTVNVGARLCSTAKASQVQLSEYVLGRLDPPPEVEEVPDLALKGVERQVKVYRLVLRDTPASVAAEPQKDAVAAR